MLYTDVVHASFLSLYLAGSWLRQAALRPAEVASHLVSRVSYRAELVTCLL